MKKIRATFLGNYRSTSVLFGVKIITMKNLFIKIH